MKSRAFLEYVFLSTDADHMELEANAYAEKGWRVVTVVQITPARYRLLLERKKAEE